MNQKKMMEELTKSFAKNVGVELKFEPSKSLKGYRRGRALTCVEVKKFSDTEVPVWVYCKADDEEDPRSDGPFWVENYDPKTNEVGLSDGSSFAHDMQLGGDEFEAEDGKGGWGTIQIYEAIKMTAEEQKRAKVTAKAVAKLLKKCERLMKEGP